MILIDSQLNTLLRGEEICKLMKTQYNITAKCWSSHQVVIEIIEYDKQKYDSIGCLIIAFKECLHLTNWYLDETALQSVCCHLDIKIKSLKKQLQNYSR